MKSQKTEGKKGKGDKGGRQGDGKRRNRKEAWVGGWVGGGCGRAGGAGRGWDGQV